MCSTCFPRLGLCRPKRLRFPHAGSLREERVPLLRRYYQRATDFLPPVPQRLIAPRLAPPQTPLFLFALRRTGAPPKPGVGDPVSPAGTSLRKRWDLPSSWGAPIVQFAHVPHRRLRRTADFRPLRCRDMAPWSSNGKGSCRRVFRRLNSMAFGLAIYASQCGLPRPYAKLASGRWSQRLPDGLSTRKVPLKGFRSASYISSSLPKLLGAIE